MRCCCIETRDIIILRKIIDYCNRIQNNIDRFNGSVEAFSSDLLFQDACCMCVVQIGELVGQLSEDAKKKNTAIPWRAIKDTRNFYVHAYGSIDIPSVWDTITIDIPSLREACQELIKEV